MRPILNIETSTEICSVAISSNNKLLAEQIENSGQNHAKLLTILIQNALTKSGILMQDLVAVAISKGPGSYTGLRIGTSVAKGICYALGIPLIAVNTLQAISNTSLIETPLSCSMIDARRMEVYCQFFNNTLKEKSEAEAKILESNTFSNLLDENKITFIGNGSQKFQDICKHKNAYFIENITTPLASQMIPLSTLLFQKEIFEDVAYFTPFYLKKFQVTQSKKKIL